MGPPILRLTPLATPERPTAQALRRQVRSRREAIAIRRRQDGRSFSCCRICRGGMRIRFMTIVNTVFSMLTYWKQAAQNRRLATLFSKNDNVLAHVMACDAFRHWSRVSSQ